MIARTITAAGLSAALAWLSAVPAQAAEYRIPDGTRIAVRLMQPLSSATLKDNDPVSFAIVEDVMVDDQVVIKQGTPVRGLIVEAEAKRRMGRAPSSGSNPPASSKASTTPGATSSRMPRVANEPLSSVNNSCVTARICSRLRGAKKRTSSKRL